LELDTNWLQKAGVSGPLTLKHVYLADINTNFPVTNELDMDVQNSNINLPLRSEMRDMEITETMRFGVRPAEIHLNATVTGALVLVHGYCSNVNPWKASSSSFTNAYYFEDPNANLSNDNFAKKVLKFADGNGLKSYSIVGHSQGGIVGTHMHNYYWTGLDINSGAGAIVQSVGSPYKGCTGAGSAANLVKIFGYGCGENGDMTVDGGAAWLAGISIAVRQRICYYTTTYQLGNFFGDYCNMAVNLVLKWPNDGVTELDWAHMPNGVNKGNTQKQCHTTDMSYPAQYADAARNKILNANAAR